MSCQSVRVARWPAHKCTHAAKVKAAERGCDQTLPPPPPPSTSTHHSICIYVRQCIVGDAIIRPSIKSHLICCCNAAHRFHSHDPANYKFENCIRNSTSATPTLDMKSSIDVMFVRSSGRMIMAFAIPPLYLGIRAHRSDANNSSRLRQMRENANTNKRLENGIFDRHRPMTDVFNLPYQHEHCRLQPKQFVE